MWDFNMFIVNVVNVICSIVTLCFYSIGALLILAWTISLWAMFLEKVKG